MFLVAGIAPHRNGQNGGPSTKQSIGFKSRLRQPYVLLSNKLYAGGLPLFLKKVGYLVCFAAFSVLK
ncbi:hypothetical protein BC343_16265 [Mucilaginibacter pedocola]|uniref:Uncharacterized protein n=1 Tax=Mucilaginibacter pedocola TaxID=1792845 RepID=A0A1S9P7Y9_9SPHI|nr:hypothetical protein BC343_16265 [Mucilaginibacter pedocola]